MLRHSRLFPPARRIEQNHIFGGLGFGVWGRVRVRVWAQSPSNEVAASWLNKGIIFFIYCMPVSCCAAAVQELRYLHNNNRTIQAGQKSRLLLYYNIWCSLFPRDCWQYRRSYRAVLFAHTYFSKCMSYVCSVCYEQQSVQYRPKERSNKLPRERKNSPAKRDYAAPRRMPRGPWRASKTLKACRRRWGPGNRRLSQGPSLRAPR